MDPGPLRDVLTAAAGIGTGVLSAAFGVGGAVVSTPAIRALGVGALTAIGTTLPSILPGAISGALRYGREGLIDWRAVRFTVPVGVAASVGGAFLSRVVPGEGHLLMLLTAVLLATTASRMVRPPAVATNAGGAPPADPPLPPKGLHLVGIGAAAGLLSGLLGLGGGVVLVPGFTELAKLPLKRAIATSLVCVGVFAVPGTLTHAYLGGIDWRVAILLAVGVVPGARIGAAAAIRATDRNLRLSVAGFLGLIAVVYFVGETSALLGAR